MNFLIKEYGSLVRLKDANDAESSFEKLKELGFSYCQIVYKPKVYTADDAKIIREAAKKQNVRIVSLFAGYNDSYTKWDMYESESDEDEKEPILPRHDPQFQALEKKIQKFL